jgi:putative transcriptional regulator
LQRHFLGWLVIAHWLQRPLQIAALLALVAASLAALSRTEETPGEVSLRGQLLVASPDIGDPRFAHAVVLLVRHSKAGALGIIINHPVEERPLAELLRETGEDPTGVEGQVLVFAGGPVEPGIGLVLHSAEYHRGGETLDIDGHVAMTSSPAILSDIAHHKGPAKTLIAFGYSGWGPGQLEGELALHGWITIPADDRLIFDVDRAKVWREAMARRTQPL